MDFFGVVSKTVESQAALHKTPSAYGWAGHHQVWLDGNYQHKYGGYNCELNLYQIIELQIDCENKTKHFINQSSNIEHTLCIQLEH